MDRKTPHISYNLIFSQSYNLLEVDSQECTTLWSSFLYVLGMKAPLGLAHVCRSVSQGQFRNIQSCKSELSLSSVSSL